MLSDKKQLKFLILSVIAVIVLILLAGVVLAHHPDAIDSENLGGQAIQFKDPITPDLIEEYLFNTTCWAYRVGALLLVIFVIWTAIKMMSSGPNSDRFSKAKSAFGYVLIGGLVFFGVGVIMSTIAYALGIEFIFFPNCF